MGSMVEVTVAAPLRVGTRELRRVIGLLRVPNRGEVVATGTGTALQVDQVHWREDGTPLIYVEPIAEAHTSKLLAAGWAWET